MYANFSSTFKFDDPIHGTGPIIIVLMAPVLCGHNIAFPAGDWKYHLSVLWPLEAAEQLVVSNDLYVVVTDQWISVFR